jgi:hypothetical protein
MMPSADRCNLCHALSATEPNLTSFTYNDFHNIGVGNDLVAFLASLTSNDYKVLGEKELARQRALSRTTRPQRDTERAFGPKPPRAQLPEHH